MKKLLKIASLLVIFTLFALKAQAREINYEFDLKENTIQIILTIKGNHSGSSKFKIPAIFEFDKLQLKKIKIYVNNLDTKYSVYNNFIILHHPPLANIKISYELRSLPDYYSNLYFDLTSKHFFLFGQYFLLTPILNDEELNNMSFKFIYLCGKVFSNIDHKNGVFDIKLASVQKLNDVFFVGGNVIQYRISDLGFNMFVSKEIELNKQEIINYLSQVQSIHNKFFQELEMDAVTSHYIFLYNPTSQYDIEGAQTSNVQTIMLGNRVKFDYRLKRMIAHENLHRWFNSKIFGQHLNEQGYNCWFIEGFTDYYTDYLNYKNNIISLDEYLNIYNKVLSDYFVSPFRYASNEDIGQSIHDPDLFNIAYLRGKIIAHELNYLLQYNTNNKSDLDSYIKYLIKFLYSKKTANFDLNLLEQTLHAFTGHNYSQFIDSIAKNEILAKAPYILDKRASLKHRQIKKVIYDFDFLQSQLSWLVQGVSINSEAFNAGLRDGQQILNTTKTTSGDLFFEIRDKTSIKTIKIPQKHINILIPFYEY